MNSRPFVFFLVVAGIPNLALAQYTAVVLDFEGSRGAQVRNVVERAIRNEVQIRGLRQVRRAAEELNADVTTTEGMTAVSQAQNIALFVRGQVEGNGRTGVVLIQVLGPRGRELATSRGGPPRGRRGIREVTRAAREAVRASVAALHARARAEREREGAAADSELARLSGTTATEGTDESEGSSEGPPISRLPLLEAVVGWGGRYRNADIELTEAGRSRVYSATFGELYLRALGFPLRDDPGMMSGLFAMGEFALALGLDTVNEQTRENIPTSAVRFELGGGWLFGPFGPLRLGPVLTFGYDSFSLDPNNILPTADYLYLRPAFATWIDLLGPLLQLRMDVALRVVMGTGDLSPFFGESASSLGFDAGAELVGHLDVGFTYGGRFAIQSFGLSFDGPGTPVTNSAIDGTDLRLVFTAFVGYRL